MAEDRSRILELLDEIRREEAQLSLATRDGPPAIPEPKSPDDEMDPRENEARYLRERAEELLDALSPEERRVEEESEGALRPRAGPGGDGLAVMVGHSRKSTGATAISPPFPPGIGAEEYHWNSSPHGQRPSNDCCPECLDGCGVLHRTFGEAERMLVALRLDTDLRDQHQIFVQ